MMTSFFLLDAVQQAAAMTPDGTGPSFSISSMGKSLFTISFCAILVLSLSGKAVWGTLRGGVDDHQRLRSTANSVLFWGAFAFVLGVFHTAMGLILAAASVAASSPIVPEAHELIALGVAVALGAGAYGSLVCMVGALIWFGFRHWHLKRFSSVT